MDKRETQFEVFEQKESQVRSYCRNFEAVFDRAKNAEIFSESGERYIDFFAGAGALNYGHNNPEIKEKVVEYIMRDSVMHALDMYTVAKKDFLLALNGLILEPRGLDYKTMFCGPTGTNATEAALKLARKYSGRTNVVAFTGAFHGMSAGALAMTTERYARGGAGTPLNNVSFMPFFNAMKEPMDSLDYFEYCLKSDHSGLDKPAAVFLETVQAEGGINVAPVDWLRRLRQICTDNDIAMVCDEIQVGNCRTGGFFSFERAGIIPDMVTVSKSIGGMGFPLSILLMKEKYDLFGPAEHNGTFRGNQIAFVAGGAALRYCVEKDLPSQVAKKEEIIRGYLEQEILPLHPDLRAKGLGMMWGVDFTEVDAALSKLAMGKSFARGLIQERCGDGGCVLKIFPPLTIEEDVLLEGLGIMRQAVEETLREAGRIK